MATKNTSVGAVLADKHRQEGITEGRNALLTEVYEALANWEKHGENCYCSACDVLKPAFREWNRMAAESEASVPRETDSSQTRKPGRKPVGAHE